MHDTLWNGWLAEKSKQSDDQLVDSIIFGLAYSLATEVGMGSIQIIDLIASLRVSDILDRGQRIKVRVHPKDKLNRYSIITLPVTTRLLLHSLVYQRRSLASGCYLLNGKTFPKLNGRKSRVRSLLNKRFESLRCMAKKNNPNIPYPPNWNAFCHVAHLIAFYAGVEPFLITVVRRYPLPVSHPVESTLPLRFSEIETRDSVFKITGQSLSTHNHSKSRSVALSEMKKPKIDWERDWCGRSKAVLRRLVVQLKTVSQKQIKQLSQKEKAFTYIDESIQKADELEPSQKSALHLALFWLRDYLNKHDITASTIEAYLKRAFINGLLDIADSYDLSGWDAEDHELAIESLLDRPKLGEKSKQDIISVLKMIYVFAEKHGFSENVSINFSIEGWLASSTRPELIGLHRFDALIRILIQSNTRDNLEKATVLILGFYGGLRSGEVSRLTLNDVVSLDGELYIEIHHSKSPAGRRRVPLHMLAPEESCEIVRLLYKKRTLEFLVQSTSRQNILKNIPLFGVEKSRVGYTGRYLAGACIAEVKKYMGQNFVFHSLRHSFASWLLIRWYASRYPDFVLSLAEGNHSVFGDEEQVRLTQLFASGQVGIIPNHHASDLVVLSKLIGHSGQETLFSTYIHSFHIIHEHAMNRVSKVFGIHKPNGETISAIVPKMKSRHSHKRIVDRTINGVCSYLGLDD